MPGDGIKTKVPTCVNRYTLSVALGVTPKILTLSCQNIHIGRVSQLHTAISVRGVPSPYLAARDAATLSGVISYPLLDGDPGTVQTIQQIRRLIDAGMKNPAVNRTALEILNAADPHRTHGYDDAFKAREIFKWVVRNIGYVKDPPGKELLRPADVILQVRGGDCDDINGVLLPAMLGSIGYPTQLVTISTNPAAPDEFTHIYLEVAINGRWMPLDAARPGAFFGRAAGKHIRKRIWSVLDDSYADVAGLGSYGGYAMLKVPRRARRMVSTRRVKMNPTPHLRGAANGLGFDWGSFARILDAGTTGASKIISSLKTPGGMFVPTPTTVGPSYGASGDYTVPLIIGAAVLGLALMKK